MRALALLLLVPSMVLAQGISRNEPTRTNYALQSNTLSTGTAATSPWILSTVTVTTTAGAPDGIGSWAEVTSTGLSGYFYSLVTTGVTSNQYVASVYAQKASGSGGVGMLFNCGSGSLVSCGCWTSNGTPCATISNNPIAGYCRMDIATLTTATVRMAVIASCGGSAATQALHLVPGVYGVSTGTTRFWGAQVEIGTWRGGPTSLIKTTTAPVKRIQKRI